MGETTRRAIVSIETAEMRDREGNAIGSIKKIRLADKVQALDKLARRLGLLIDKLTLKGDAENPLTMLIQAVQGSSFKPVKLSVARWTIG